MARLVGDPAMRKLRESHVMVIGLGGVGSWAAEAVVRSGVGRVTVIDFDGNSVTPEPFTVTWDVSAADKGGWPSFMAKPRPI
jgi:glutamate dehydrogenase/leucine dehydrogenase